ncbi:MAG TPA: 3-carboxyethylcatechol 2,3-dioxygenase, partial [Alphaproteobacteria bacterium]|nr:3-carboxyethylcatechol 2,3-dioxygenase [Alphaproteobacteria bacterium]
MSSMLACVSHSPIIMIRAKPPKEEPEIEALYGDCVQAIERFDPEQVIIFGSDHFAGFHLRVMPAYCVGLAAEAVDDVGGFGGKLDVPQDSALALVKS